MKKLTFLLAALMICSAAVGQSVAITDDANYSPNSSAMLDVKSNTKGMLIPRLTTAQRTAIASPADGLMVYDTDNESIYIYHSANWLEIIDEGIINTPGTNIFAGEDAGTSCTIGINNVGVGYQALNSLTSQGNNVAIGYLALKNNLAYGNTAIGFKSLLHNNNGAYNISIGSSALESNTNSGNNIAIGTYALGKIDFTNSGTQYYGYNIAIGSHSLQNLNSSNSSNGINNIAIGSSAGHGYVGTNLGTNNIFIGHEAGYNITSGSNNIVVGYDLDLPNAAGDNQVIIGASDLLYGDLTNKYIGIGTTNPDEELTIAGDIKLSSGDGHIFASGSSNSIFIGKNTAGHDSPYSSWLIADSYIQLSVDGGTDKGIRINDAGYVGVGTNSPSDKFHVQGTDNVSAKIIAGSADTSSLKLFEAGDYGFEFQYDGSNDKLDLWSRKYLGKEDIRMTWLKNGNVGIGTTSPDETLHLVGNIKISDGNQEEGRLLVSDANGKGQWQNFDLLSLFGDSLPGPDFSCISVQGELGIGEFPRSIFVSDNYAYIVDSESDDLKIIDVSNPASPALSSSLPLGTHPRSITVSGNYAYVVDAGSDDLKIIDISNPVSPVLSGSLGIGGHPNSVKVLGTYAYIVDYSSDDLKVIDVSNPVSPSLSGGLGVGSNPYAVDVTDNHAYIVDQGSDDLKVIDVSIPASPVLSGSLGIGSIPMSVAVLGDYAYVVDQGSDDLKVIDVSNPASPVLSGSYGIGPVPSSVAVSGNYAYVVDYGSDDLKVINVNNPASLVLSGSIGINSSLSVAISGNYAYVGSYTSNDLKIIKLSCYNNISIDPLDGSFVQTTLSSIHDTDHDTKIMVEESADEDRIRFDVDGSEAMIIYTDGNIGIGTTTPNQKLTLNGDFGIIEGGASPTYHTIFQGGDQSGDITYTLPTDDGTSGEVLTTDGSGVLGWNSTGDITAVGSMTSGSVFSGTSADDQWLGLGVSAGRIEFDDQATDEVNILNARVGIGTSTPTEELTVNGDIKFASGDGNIFAGSSSKSIFIGKNDAGHDSPYASWLIADSYVQLSVDGGTDKGIRINDAGYVGVGTDTPSDKFHVQGTDNVSAKIIAGSADTSSIKLFESGDYGFEFQYDGSNDKLHLWSRNYTGNEDIRMSWLKTGYVGLGTSTPLAQMHIANSQDAGLILEA
ncbi:MAG: hypothetical protein K9H15_10520, partial [Bacteroidales bacterium]|nr:hypothetical protein [Bacteroidales bacterium]